MLPTDYLQLLDWTGRHVHTGKRGTITAWNRAAFFSTAESLQQQETVGGNAQTGVMMKASPVATLEVAQPQLLLEFLIVALDLSASHHGVDHVLPRHVRGQVTEPVMRRRSRFRR